MLDNPRSPRVRAVAKLAKKSARVETGLFLLEGPQAVREALAWCPQDLAEVYATEAILDRDSSLRRLLAEKGVEVHRVTDRVLDAMADTQAPQGVVAVCRQAPTAIEQVFARGPRLVAILHEVRDPGNAGTIIRAADSAGADAVILAGQAVDLYNPKVVRSTTGSLFHLPVAMSRDADAVFAAAREAQLQLLAADMSGDDLLELRRAGTLTAPTAWVFGNEAHGLDGELLKAVDRVVTVPIYGHAESMNLATAAAVCLYESSFAQRA